MTATDADATPTGGEALEAHEPAETPAPSVPQQMFDLPAGNRHNIADSVSAPVITALPGDGWRVRCTSSRNGQEWTDRVVA
ncbi:hypothetical protein ACGRHY_28560 [Streptomyces sp. HK10]|uniref:hypothetical protein n=1 Tax=Streptomyces sp. HK10 TaxID=3373255 RepID=UPI003749A25D